MVKTRLSLILLCGVNLIQSGIIAVRYAVCRRQFANKRGTKEERQLIDYQTHMAQIAPPIANGMVILITYKLMKNLNKQSDEAVKKGNFKLLPVLHHITAGLKALGSEMMYLGMDELRQACGGAGYSLASGISSAFL
jgi:hypothetical protein